MDSKSALRRLQKEGWEIVRQSGSHVTLKHVKIRDLITIPHPRKDLSKGVQRQIQRTARWR